MSDLKSTGLPTRESIASDSKPLTSAAIARLVEEVRLAADGELPDVTAYNRTYHRHNR